MFVGSAFLVFGIGALCALICRLAVDALPAFVACTAGFWAYGTGAGPIGASMVALLAGVGTLAAGRFVFSSTRNGVVRLLVALLFAAPAAFTGYNVVFGLAHLVMESDGWQHVFAGMGALIIGLTAAVRLSEFDRAILAAERSRSHPRPRCQALGKTG